MNFIEAIIWMSENPENICTNDFYWRGDERKTLYRVANGQLEEYLGEFGHKGKVWITPTESFEEYNQAEWHKKD